MEEEGPADVPLILDRANGANNIRMSAEATDPLHRPTLHMPWGTATNRTLG